MHAVLMDPALGEDAFPVYLPDMEAVRADRSGGGPSSPSALSRPALC